MAQGVDSAARLDATLYKVQSGSLPRRHRRQNSRHPLGVRTTLLSRIGSARREVLRLAGDRERDDLSQPAAAADFGPVAEDLLRLPAAGPLVVLDDERVQPL